MDVGGGGKGFHVAVVDCLGLIALERLREPAAVAAWLREGVDGGPPALVAVDSPREAAEPGELSRADERLFARARICGIRFTPDRATIDAPRANGDDFYGWIRNGFALYVALEEAGLPAVECFPTASWTRWGGARDGRRRAAWSQQVLDGLGVAGLPARRLSQDDRDAVAAALTARAHAGPPRKGTESFGAIVVPRGGKGRS